jgi:hypothetical protein
MQQMGDGMMPLDGMAAGSVNGKLNNVTGNGECGCFCVGSATVPVALPGVSPGNPLG